MDEFEAIAELFAPLGFGAPEALGLLDDAAVLRSRPGQDLVITKDAVVEGVHFLEGTAPELIARKLLRCNLSDLAAKGAEPYACLLAVAWPGTWTAGDRRAFAAGLREDLERFALPLIGGDTVTARGGFWASLTALGWVEEGACVLRRGAKPGDELWVSGTVGDALLGLRSLTGALGSASAEDRRRLEGRHLLPEPRNELRPVLRAFAAAAADVSDGLLADARHLAAPFDLGLEIELDALPLSPAAERWLAGEGDRTGGLMALATGGDDYEIVLALAPDRSAAASRAAEGCGVRLTRIGRFTERSGLRVLCGGSEVPVGRLGWMHG